MCAQGLRANAPPSSSGSLLDSSVLDGLACVAKSARGRAHLLQAGTPAHLGELLASGCLLWQESRGPDSLADAQLLGLLRVLRNLCAAGSAVSAALLRCSVPEQVAALVLLAALSGAPQSSQSGGRCGLVCAQLASDSIFTQNE